MEKHSKEKEQNSKKQFFRSEKSVFYNFFPGKYRQKYGLKMYY